MGRGKSLTRGKGFRPERRRFLIYCEGECTEDHYFKGLRKELRALPVSVCIGGTHGEPKTLVRAAIAHKKRAPQSAMDRYAAYDEVWCVMDVEAPRPHPSLDEAMRLAGRNGIGVALTNPCFELWLLLHYTTVSRHHTSGEMQQALERLDVCGYTAQRKHVDFEALRDGYEQARERAQALRVGESVNHRTNPWTDVDKLVELLREARYGRLDQQRK